MKKLEKQLFSILNEGWNKFSCFANEYIKNHSQRDFARLFIRSMNDYLHDNETLFFEGLLFMEPLKYKEFWEEILEVQEMFNIFSDVVDVCHFHELYEVKKVYGGELFTKLVNNLKEKYEYKSLKPLVIDEDEYQIWNWFLKYQNHNCPECKGKLRQVEIKEYDNDSLRACPKDKLIFLDRNEFLRYIKGFKL